MHYKQIECLLEQGVDPIDVLIGAWEELCELVETGAHISQNHGCPLCVAYEGDCSVCPAGGISYNDIVDLFWDTVSAGDPSLELAQQILDLARSLE